jgi:hypothetical protein
LNSFKEVAYFIYRYLFPLLAVLFIVNGFSGQSHLVINTSIWFGIAFAVISIFVWFDYFTKPKHNRTLLGNRYGHITASRNRIIYSAGGAGEDFLIPSIELHDLRTGNSKQISNALTPRRYLCGELYDRRLHLIGGETTDGPTELHRTFQVETGEWERRRDLPEARRFVSSACVGDRIFVFGGETGEGYTDRVDVYRIPDDEWEKVSSLPQPKNTSVTALDGFIYVSGGFNGNSLKEFHKYDPEDDEWEQLPDLPQAVSAHSTLGYQNTIYTFGSYDNLSLTLRYDIKTQAWEKIDLNFLPARHQGATLINDTAYVTGGNQSASGNRLDFIQEFQLNQRNLTDTGNFEVGEIS